MQLRWARTFAFRKTAVVVLIQQTFALPIGNEENLPTSLGAVDVEGAGLRVVVELKDGAATAIRGIVSTLFHDEIVVTDTPVDISSRIGPEVAAAVARAAGLPRQPVGFLAEQDLPVFLQQFNGVPVPAIDGALLVPGHFYPVRKPRLPRPTPTEINVWIPWASRKVPIAVIIRATGLSANAAGCVFIHDPFTAFGDLSLRRNASSATLGSACTPVPLPKLTQPDNGQKWQLRSKGLNVDGGRPNHVPGETRAEPPQSDTGQFDYDVRTNDFAAVNAYYHTQAMLDLLDRFDLPLDQFAMVLDGRTSAVVQVIPRATITPGPCHDGNCINAQAEIIPGMPQTLQMRFALADLQRLPGQPDKPVEPLGIACDVRVVWHEFCHLLISAATNYPEFRFAHSAGDALAAIMGDPASKLRNPVGEYPATLRFDTFPWGTAPNRRHDRPWPWSGPLGTEIDYTTDIRDLAGYAREQVLSTTLFRYYRAVGGDSTHLDARVAAAEYASYLIIAAIHLQGEATIVPANNASVFLLSMLVAEAAAPIGPSPYHWVGGITNKVLDWAFQKQQLPPLAGAPLPDIYVANDQRNGDYAWKRQWHTGSEGIWITDASGNPQDPAAGAPNHVYVAVNNRSTTAAMQVAVSLYVAKQPRDTTFSTSLAGWTNLPLAPSAAATQDQATAGETLNFGPFEWTPDAGTQYTLLAISGCPDDLPNTDPAARLPCSYLETPLADLVRFDNNLAARRLDVP